MNQNSVPGKVDEVSEIAAADYISAHLSGEKKTVVLFEMSGCPFCRMFKPAFEALVEQRCGDYAFLLVRLDAYDNPLWQKYEIAAVPTVIVFSGGKISSRVDATPMLGISKKKWAAFRASLK